MNELDTLSVETAGGSELAAAVEALASEGELDRGSPAYEVALAAIFRGYGGLTRVQKKLFDREIAPHLSELKASKTAAADARAWKPIREAPAEAEVQLGVREGEGISQVSSPARRMGRSWVWSATGKRLFIAPTHWREWRGD